MLIDEKTYIPENELPLYGEIDVCEALKCKHYDGKWCNSSALSSYCPASDYDLLYELYNQ